MLSTSASKVVASAFVVLASASGMAGFEKASTMHPRPVEIPVVLDSTSLLVSTMANGETEMHWMDREACERVASAVASGKSVAGVRADGVRSTIAKANCSTRRIEVDPSAVAISTADVRN